jgi:glycosyltransferase involved in cell wall biosynthesis
MSKFQHSWREAAHNGPRRVSVIIPVRNEGLRIAETVESIVRGRRWFPELEIVIVDDASEDDACAALAAWSDTAAGVLLRVRRLHAWSGIPFARNRGAEVATGDVFLITDGNTVFPADWDVTLMRRFRPEALWTSRIQDVASPFAGYGCQLEFPSMGVHWITSPDAYGGRVPISPCTFTAISRELFHEIGGYNESLPLYGAAEPEFSVRAWRLGHEIHVIPELVIGHHFRAPSRHRRFIESISPTLVANCLGFAGLHLPVHLQDLVLRHYRHRQPDEFDAWAATAERLRRDDARARLSRQCTRDFEWFAREFDVQGVPRSAKSAGGLSNHLSAVILSHDKYLPMLPAVLQAVLAQRDVLREVVLVLNCPAQACGTLELPDYVTVVQRQFDSPNAARTAGLAHVSADWVCYVDGDNLTAPDYLRRMSELTACAAEDVAIIYPDIVRLGADGRRRRLELPRWSYWGCRERSIIDTCSAWRVAALRRAGGWFAKAGCLQDYATALSITEQGWRATRADGLCAPLSDHADNLHKRSERIAPALWHARRHAVVTLFAGRRDCLARLMRWYEAEDFPPRTHVVWVDDSRDAEFGALLRACAQRLRPRFEKLEVWSVRSPKRPMDSFDNIHSHVADLYNEVLANVRGDIYLTVEDDVIAPPGSMRKLLDSPTLAPGSNWAAVCAVYPSRSDPRFTCASGGVDRWAAIARRDIPQQLVQVGMIGAGFAAWSGPALHRAGPLGISSGPDGSRFGWDGTLSRRLHELGYVLGVEGRIVCEHLVGGAVRAPASRLKTQAA